MFQNLSLDLNLSAILSVIPLITNESEQIVSYVTDVS